MASISYEAVFSEFLGNVTDYSFFEADAADVNAQMVEWLHKVFAQPYIRQMFSSISFNDEVQLIFFEIEHSASDDADIEFVQYVAAKGMVVEWLEPKVKKTSLLNQFFAGKEQTFYAQANQLSELKELLQDTKDELRKLIRDHGYLYNSYLGGT